MSSEEKFVLDSRLKNDSFPIASLKLSELRLINNADFLWLILVPEIKNTVEITDLTEKQYDTLCGEIRAIAKLIKREFKPNKLNIASIGNVVSQLHVHIVGRYKGDKLFPKPVWGHDFTPYATGEAEKMIAKISKGLNSLNYIKD